MKNNIFFWGAKYKAGIIYNLIQKKQLININKNLKVSFLFDPGLSKQTFNTKAKFSNKKIDLFKFLKKSNFFVTCIGNEYGKARYMISKKLEKKLTPLSIISKHSTISDVKNIGTGVQIFPNSILNENSTIGDYTILNTSSLVEHDCILGSGVHVMPGAVLGGNVVVKDFVMIGLNATILPNITIEEGAFIGAGSVVTKNVKKNEVVIGNPAKFIRKNKHTISIKFL